MSNQKYKLKIKLLQLMGKSTPADFAGDDFDWRVYSTHYAAELEEVEREFTARLAPQDYAFADGVLQKQAAVRPLHPNHRLLYETLLQLRPESVREMGCGAGDHLYNLSVLSPDMRLFGVDRSQQQLNFLKRRSPNLQASIACVDITQPLPESQAEVDITYTQAVIMHIQTENHHLIALANLFKSAGKQVVLMENWKKHSFMDDIRQLHDQGLIPWKDLHFYFRRAPEINDRPHLMVVSASPLDYEPLEDYHSLLAQG